MSKTIWQVPGKPELACLDFPCARRNLNGSFYHHIRTTVIQINSQLPFHGAKISLVIQYSIQRIVSNNNNIESYYFSRFFPLISTCVMPYSSKTTFSSPLYPSHCLSTSQCLSFSKELKSDFAFAVLTSDFFGIRKVTKTPETYQLL